MRANDATRTAVGKTGAEILDEAKVLAAVMRRLEARAHLSQLARETWHGIAAAQQLSTQPYVGETAASVCGNKQNPTVNFECAEADYTCDSKNYPNGFNCGTDGYPVFNCSDGSDFNCDGMGDFSCGGDDSSQVYDCTSDVYDCYNFACDTGDGCGFQCSTELDFLCDVGYDCNDVFDCTSGHVFFCANINNCIQNFGCTATGDTDCNPDTTPYTPPGNDGSPGDFLCGWVGGWVGGNPVGEVFQCSTFFTCNGGDDFDCNQDTNFQCGINNSSNFSCTAEGTFACDSQVNCSGTYTGCPSPTTQYSPPVS